MSGLIKSFTAIALQMANHHNGQLEMGNGLKRPANLYHYVHDERKVTTFSALKLIGRIVARTHMTFFSRSADSNTKSADFSGYFVVVRRLPIYKIFNIYLLIQSASGNRPRIIIGQRQNGQVGIGL